MLNHAEVSAEQLNAFIDNELDADDKARLLEQMAADAGLRARVCELWQLKELVRGGYPLDGGKRGRQGCSRAAETPRWAQALAASVVLVAGAAVGWLLHGNSSAHGLAAGPAAGSQAIAAAGATAAADRIVLHLESGDPEKLKAALDEVEKLSIGQSGAASPPRVELVANGQGLKLLRADVSPYAARVRTLQDAHANVNFVACRVAIRALQRQGVQVKLIPHVDVAASAPDEILLRLQQGWRYRHI